MLDSKDEQKDIGENDVSFECPQCGKSLSIDYRGAGLMIRCPVCREEIQVPIPEGVDIADIDRLGAVEVRGVEEPEEAVRFPESPDEIRILMTELEEMRFRRRYLENQRADTVKWIQDIGQQVAVIRTRLDEIEDVLKHLNEPSADDTQNLL